MEKNPAYGFVQQTTANEIPPTDGNTYELVDLPVIDKQSDKTNVVGERQKTTIVDKTPRGRSIVGVAVAIIIAVLALMVAVGAVIGIIVVSQTDNSGQEIQSFQLEVANLREKLNQTRDNSNQEIQSLQLEIANLRENLIIEVGILRNNLTYTGTILNPASSCNDISQDSPSGEYWIRTSVTNSPVQVYCDMNRTCCNSTTGGWTRVANLDMTDPSQQCPDGFRLVTRTTAPLRTCGRPYNFGGCVSTTFPVHGIEYTHVCGRVIGYQLGTPEAFQVYSYYQSVTIDGYYVDGISITHGQSPRQHIWTFVATEWERTANAYSCPCTQPSYSYQGIIPPYVGQDYFCDNASKNERYVYTFYPDDPLWDGQGCGGTSTCCSFNNPPWFCKQLPQPTTDNIELRLCANQDAGNEDTPLEIVEVYIK